jgi:hypothetical protein
MPSAFDAIRKAESFSTPKEKFESLQKSHMAGEYDESPGMKSGRYDSTGRRHRDGRKIIKGYSTGQRLAGAAAREAQVQQDMNDLRVGNQPYRSQIGRQGGRSSQVKGRGM